MGMREKLLAAGLILGTTFSPAQAAAPRRAGSSGERVNLLSNGGFEEGLVGWQPAAGHELVKDRAASHSGEACLTGEVTQPKQALTLRRRVRVQAGNLYELVIWARATNRTKLVLWVTQPGAKARTMAASWRQVPKKWRRYATSLTVQRDGLLDLHIIAPSSHGEPPGRIWIDDIALYETAMPPLVAVSGGVGFNDEPAIAQAADGTVVVAWNSFRPLASSGRAPGKAEGRPTPVGTHSGADSLQIAQYKPQGKAFQRLGAQQVVGGKGTYILGITAVPAGRNVVALYAAEVQKNWDIFAVACGADGPGKPLAVTTDAAVDVKPAAAWHNGTLWVAWESNRNGCRQIFATSMQGGKAARPVAVSDPGASSYGPSVAALAGGEVCVAWHGFGRNNYDVFLRRRSADGTWGPTRRLTRAATIDRHAVLVARGDELWVVYENAQTGRYHIGATNRRRLIAAKVTPKGLLAPKGLRDSPLAGRCEAASAAFDAGGRLWVAFRRPRLPRAGWDAFLTCFSGSRWQRPVPLSGGKGMDRPPVLVVKGSGAIVALQSDDIPNSWSTVDRTPQARSDIFLASADLSSAPRADRMALEPLAEPDEPFEAGTIRVERGEDTPTQSITYQGKTLKLFWGDLHEHTDVSVCNRVGDQSVDESYQHMRDLARYDFACATDHGYNINAYLWGYLAKLARVNDDPGRFLTFLGEEWTSSFEKYSTKHPYGYYGHRNLVFADPYFPRWWNARNGQTPAQVWEQLRKLNANFIHIPHQLADTGNVPIDWDFADQTAQPVAEIFQTRGSYEYKGTPREARRSAPKPGYFLQDAWARGIVIGVIASPDHGGGYGKAAVYAPELTRQAILDALRRRHCYGTTAAKIFLDARVNGHLMGEKVAQAAGKSVEVKVAVRCPRDIERVEVCRNNKFIYTRTPKGRSADFTFTDRDPLPARSYYYVRVLQKDQEIAWSSPVWLGAK